MEHRGALLSSTSLAQLPPRGSRLRGARRFVTTAALLGLSALFVSGSAMAQSDDDKSAARALATQGSEALAANKFGEALDLVSRAEQLLHAPTHLLMIARAQTGLGHFVSAKEAYLKILREDLAATAPPAFKRAQHDAKDELALVEPKIASLRIVLEGAGTQKVGVKLDGTLQNAALVGVYRPMDPGKHEVVATPESGAPVQLFVELKPGEKRDLNVSLTGAAAVASIPHIDPAPHADPALSPAPDPTVVTVPGPFAAHDQVDLGPGSSHGFFTPVRGIGLGLGVLGLGGVAVGAIFMSKGSSLQSDADTAYTACGQHCTAAEQTTIKSQDDDAASKKTIGAVGLIAGGAALVAGVTMLVVGKPAAKPNSAFVTPWFGGAAGGLGGAF